MPSLWSRYLTLRAVSHTPISRLRSSTRAALDLYWLDPTVEPGGETFQVGDWNRNARQFLLCSARIGEAAENSAQRRQGLIRRGTVRGSRIRRRSVAARFMEGWLRDQGPIRLDASGRADRAVSSAHVPIMGRRPGRRLAEGADDRDQEPRRRERLTRALRRREAAAAAMLELPRGEVPMDKLYQCRPCCSRSAPSSCAARRTIVSQSMASLISTVIRGSSSSGKKISGTSGWRPSRSRSKRYSAIFSVSPAGQPGIAHDWCSSANRVAVSRHCCRTWRTGPPAENCDQARCNRYPHG